LVLVGGVVHNNSHPAGLTFSHLVLILEEGGDGSDRVGTVRFVGAPPETDPCAAVASNVGFIARVPLERGNVTFTL
jgi:hypothetical protein